jgi:hypothetical protein
MAKCPLNQTSAKPLPAAELGRARLEGEERIAPVELGGRAVPDQCAQVEKVLLIDLALGRRVAAPFFDKLCGSIVSFRLRGDCQPIVARTRQTRKRKQW